MGLGRRSWNGGWGGGGVWIDLMGAWGLGVGENEKWE